MPHIREGFDARKTLKRAFAKIMAINLFKKGTQSNNILTTDLGINAGDVHQELKSPLGHAAK
jgi:hypothetical protein